MRKLKGWALCGLGGLAAVALVVATDRGEHVVEAVPSAERLHTRSVPPAPPDLSEAFAPAERAALARLGEAIDGRSVWSSNREGDHELYLAPLGTGEVRRLTNDPHVDYYSRFSPRLLWVSGTGSGGTRIMQGRPDRVGGDVLMDLSGAYSHEYLPRVTPDGRWLVWGAAAEGHEHDRAMVCVALMFTSMPVLYEWFNVEPARVAPLWTLGARLP